MFTTLQYEYSQASIYNEFKRFDTPPKYGEQLPNRITL
jgi:hypothetical protein